MIKFSYHVYEIINASLFHRDRRDFSEFLLHHIVTITMVGYAYGTNIIPIGGPIMLVMDASDVLVAVFKLTVDAYDKLQFPCFVTMIAGWVYFRLWFFPVYCMTEIWTQANATGHFSAIGVIKILFAFLCVLQILNLFWFWLMIKGLIRRLTESAEDRKKKTYFKIG